MWILWTSLALAADPAPDAAPTSEIVPEAAPDAAPEAPVPADRLPRLIKDAVPEFPEAARARGIAGDVIIQLTVLEDGRVDQVELLQAPDELLALPAMEAAHRLRFEPAIQDGEPVQAQIRYRFHFDLGRVEQQGTPVPGSVHAQVTDDMGLPVPGVTVTLRHGDETRTITTEEDGTFRAPFLESGVWKAEINHPAFAPITAQVEIRAGELLERSFTLFPVGAHDMVVTYERQTWREVERAPMQADTSTVTGSYTLTRRDIEANPGSMEDVSRAVHSLPGVVSDGDMLASFHARGGETDDVVFMLDRVPLQNPFHLAGFNSIFNPDMISRVRFFASAAPADVPSGTSAVLAVQSWDGSPRQDDDGIDGALDISASSLRALAMGPIGDKLNFALAARRSYLESYFQVMKWANIVDTAFAAPEFSELSGRLAWRPDARNRVIFTAMRSGDSLALVDSSDASLINFSGRFELDNSLSLFSLDHLYEASDDLTLQSTSAWTRDRSFLLRDMGGQYRQDVLTNRWFGRSDLTLRRGSSTVGMGIDFAYNAVDADGMLEDTRVDPTWANTPLADYGRDKVALQDSLLYPEASAYVQEVWEGPVQVRLGGRVHGTGATNEVLVSPSGGLSVPLPTGTVPKISGGIYHKTPQDPRVYDPELGNPDIQSERAVHMVAGLDQGFPLPGDDAGGLLRVEAYHVVLDNLVVTPDTAAAVAAGTSYTNDGSGTNDGVDVMLGVQAGRFRGTATASYLVASRTNPLNQVFPQTIAPAQDQRVTTGTALEYQVSTRWRATARYTYHSGRPYSSVRVVDGTDTVEVSGLNDQRLGAFNDLDLRVEWRKAMRAYRLTFYAEVLNTLNLHSDFIPIVDVQDGERTDSMLEHLPARPFMGVRADF